MQHGYETINCWRNSLVPEVQILETKKMNDLKRNKLCFVKSDCLFYGNSDPLKQFSCHFQHIGLHRTSSVTANQFLYYCILATVTFLLEILPEFQWVGTLISLRFLPLTCPMVPLNSTLAHIRGSHLCQTGLCWYLSFIPHKRSQWPEFRSQQ